MKPFENALKEAAERYIRNEYSETVSSPCSPETKKKIENILSDPLSGRTTMHRKSLAKCLTAAILAVLLLSSVVCAAVPEIRGRFMDLLSAANTADSVWYEKIYTVSEYFDAVEEEAPPEVEDILRQAIQYFEAAEEDKP